MRTIWLASYPKSGSTWFRMLLANLWSEEGTPADINDLPVRGGIASARGPFDHLTLIPSGLLTHDEAEILRPRVYEALAAGVRDDLCDGVPDAPAVRFVKVHDAYTQTANGEPLLAGVRGAAGAIVIVRDPRDVAPSLANHNGSTIDEAIAFMADAEAAFCGRARRQSNQLRQKLPGWSGHVASWLDQKDIPVHLVRYEDMSTAPEETLAAALAFAEQPVSHGRIEAAIRLAAFSQLRQQELEKGFREAPRPRPDGNFFRRGEVGAWRDELSMEQVSCLEESHGAMMLRLGYELACEPACKPSAVGEVA